MTTQSYLYRLRMFFNVATAGLDLAGWSEQVDLQAASYSDALTAGAAILTARALLMPADCSIIYARIAKVGKPRDSVKVPGAYPVAGSASTLTTPPTGTTVGEPNQALLIRFQAIVGTPPLSEQGNFANYFLHGIPSNLIRDRRLVDNSGSAVTISVSAPAAFPAPPVATYAAALANYLAGLWNLSQYAVRLADLGTTPPTPQFTVAPWTGVSLEGGTTHKTGRPFRLRRGRAVPR